MRATVTQVDVAVLADLGVGEREKKKLISDEERRGASEETLIPRDAAHFLRPEYARVPWARSHDIWPGFHGCQRILTQLRQTDLLTPTGVG